MLAQEDHAGQHEERADTGAEDTVIKANDRCNRHAEQAGRYLCLARLFIRLWAEGKVGGYQNQQWWDARLQNAFGHVSYRQGTQRPSDK
ncbi:hypothetical protein D3C75_904170 [compost metagenome]